jgi:hypothetical protein
VVLDSQGYLIDLASYRKRVNEPFAPKRRAGDPGYGDQALASVWAQENWQQGFGFDRWDPSWTNRKAGFKTGTNLDVHFGDLRMGRSALEVHAPVGVTELFNLLSYSTRIFATRGDGQQIYESADGTTWAVSLSSGASAVGPMCHFNGWLIAANLLNGRLHKFDDTTWTTDWVTLTGVGVGASALISYVINATEYLFVGQTQSAGASRLYQVHSGGTNVVAATFREAVISALAVQDNLLWIATQEGTFHGALYTYDGTNVREITRLSDNAITTMHVFNNRLYGASRTRGKVWSIDRQGLEEIFTIPDFEGVGGVSTYDKPIYQLAVDDGRLFLPAFDANSHSLYAFDGVGWSNLVAGHGGDEARGIAAHKGDVYASTKRASGAHTVRIERKSPTAGIWTSAAFNAGLAATQKLWVQLSLFHVALAAGEAITIDYELDLSGTWTNLGLSDADGATSRTLNFATDTTGRHLRIRLTFALTTQTVTPKVQGLIVRYLVQPDVKAEWEFDVLLEGAAATPLIRLDNSNEPTAGPALADALWTSRGKKQVLAFTDLDTEVKSVYFTELEEKVSPGATQRLGHQTRAQVTLVEA